MTRENFQNGEKARIDGHSIVDAYAGFVKLHDKRPSIILMHPIDAKKLTEWAQREFGYNPENNVLFFMDLKIIRSADINEGDWRLY